MNKFKRKLIGLSLFIIFVTFLIENKYEKENIKIEKKDYYASYSKGNVYIGDKEFLDAVDYKEGDILVEDLRYLSDPNMKIINSNSIHDKNNRNEILKILCLYEEEYPSNWDRSIESMRLEWYLHNLGYDSNIKVNRTVDVDLNNSDEEKYKNKVLNKIKI